MYVLQELQYVKLFYKKFTAIVVSACNIDARRVTSVLIMAKTVLFWLTNVAYRKEGGLVRPKKMKEITR